MSDEGFAPLEGIKVIELGDGIAGPMCGRMLADLGADVIKLERLPHGDGTRTAATADDGRDPFAALNRNKRGIAADLARPEGVTLARRLLRTADVAIEGWPAGTLERLGLGYDSVRPHNPGLVWCELSPEADATAGILAATGTLAALLHRLLTGDGQRVEVEGAGDPSAPEIGCPVKLGGSTAAIARAAPAFGEHTREVLLEQGYSDDGVAELRNAGIVHCAG